jgi:S1-C subfamily serine protease
MQIEADVSIAERALVYGYPPVPLTRDAFLVCSVGEISSKVVTYFDSTEYLVLSCLIRPGNSGGPVLNENGAVVGVITQNFLNQLPSEGMPGAGSVDLHKGLGFAAAIPAKHLLSFV